MPRVEIEKVERLPISKVLIEEHTNYKYDTYIRAARKYGGIAQVLTIKDSKQVLSFMSTIRRRLRTLKWISEVGMKRLSLHKVAIFKFRKRKPYAPRKPIHIPAAEEDK